MGTRNVNGIQIDTAPMNPAIPLRNFDWVASEQNYDLGRPLGFGRTEQDAINDLLEQLEQ